MTKILFSRKIGRRKISRRTIAWQTIDRQSTHNYSLEFSSPGDSLQRQFAVQLLVEKMLAGQLLAEKLLAESIAMLDNYSMYNWPTGNFSGLVLDGLWLVRKFLADTISRWTFVGWPSAPWTIVCWVNGFAIVEQLLARRTIAR